MEAIFILRCILCKTKEKRYAYEVRGRNYPPSCKKCGRPMTFEKIEASGKKAVDNYAR